MLGADLRRARVARLEDAGQLGARQAGVEGGRDDKGVIDEVERGEDVIKAKFEAAARDGFKGVECLFPHEHPTAEVQARLQAHPMERFTEHTTTDVDALLAHIRQARQQGWCLVNQELEEGLISIAAPLTNRTGQTVAALNISGQANRTSAAVMQESLLPALLSAARTISRMMGAPRG